MKTGFDSFEIKQKKPRRISDKQRTWQGEGNVKYWGRI